jgi:hypothetical protein
MDLIKNYNIYKVSNRYKKLSHNKPIKIIKKTKKVFFKVIPKHKINKINKVYNIIYQKIRLKKIQNKLCILNHNLKL